MDWRHEEEQYNNLKAIETIKNGGTMPVSEDENMATEGEQQPADQVTTSTNPSSS